MIKASIDIGTNSVLLLVADVHGKSIQPLEEQQHIPRLGRGVDLNKNLSEESRLRVIGVLKEYRQYLEDSYPETADHTMVTATSAVRDASNREEFLRQIKEQTGWSVQLLSGEDEARVTFEGALSVLSTDSNSYYTIIDIGGGSTEISTGTPSELKSYKSADMGSVRFTERYLKSDPPKQNEITAAEQEILRLMNVENVPADETVPVGVAGTVTSLAAIEAGLTTYNADLVNGYHLKKKSIEKFIDEFSTSESKIIEQKYPLFLKGRGDVILAGALILKAFLTWCNKDEILVSTGGIRHGILLQQK